MTAKILPFTPKPVNPSTPPAAPDMQTRVTTALDLTSLLLRNDDHHPNCLFLMYGTHGEKGEHVWRYLAMEIPEADLRQAMERIYADMRQVPDQDST